MTASIIIITLNRPDCVRKCLDCLAQQTRLPDEIIVVDASPGTETRAIVTDYPRVIYLRNENGFGRMTTSRNISLRHATSDIIAFIDDDAFAHKTWLENLVSTYTDAAVGAIGGRACNNVPNEAIYRMRDLGRLKPNGEITGFFGADPGKVIPVDHIIGCNMSFRRYVLAQLGGFRDDYPGGAMCEDTDMSVRVRLIGYRILFNPAAVVDHIGAPRVTDTRFDWRYALFGQRNQIVLFIRNFGLLSGYPWRHLFHSAYRDARGFARRILAGPTQWGEAFSTVFGTIVGTVLGWPEGIYRLIKERRDPVRHNAEGQAITAALSRASALAEMNKCELPSAVFQS